MGAPHLDLDSIVPPERWGALLHRTRCRDGRTLVGVSRMLDGWTPDMLADVERGRPVPDDDLADLARAYHVVGWLDPSPWKLVLDRSTDTDLDDRSDSRRSHAAAVVRAAGLAAVCSVDLNASVQVALLAEWLDIDHDRVQLDVARVERGGDVASWLAEASHQWCVPAAGLRVGSTPSGSLSFVTVGGGQVERSTVNAAVVRLGELSGRVGPGLVLG